MAFVGEGELGYPVRPVPFTAVRTEDLFWTPRIEMNREVTVPFAFGQCEASGRVELFRRAARALAGEPGVDKTAPGYPFDDTDLYKVIEGAAYTLSGQPDPALEAYVDGLVEIIAAAQEPDGYLYTTRAIDPEHPHKWAGSARWELELENSHELYNLGHLYEAAVAYAQATGKGELLNVALRSADLLVRTFGPEGKAIWPGHQITEMGLVKLTRATGDPRYLALAKFMLDSRGPDGFAGSGREYNQSHARVVEQREAVGHAVRATYMYSGMADVAALTGDSGYVGAIDRIWEDVVRSKLYITGGIGATSEGEAFGGPYELPNLTAYCETCASIGNVFWNHRLFLLRGDGRYVDVLERTLYNALLAGVSLDGMRFFYENPLESLGGYARRPWFGCACCPSNVARFLPSLPGYVYAQEGDSLYVNLFVAGTVEIEMGDGRVVRVAQETTYPWDGKVKLRVDLEGKSRFAIRVRVPGWARGEVVPSDLYRFVDVSDDEVVLTVNGEPVGLDLDRGYACIAREWRAGDEILLDLPMPVRWVAAHERVEANRGRVALQRGPLVYCIEGPDYAEGRAREVALSEDAVLRGEFAPDLLGGVVVIKAEGQVEFVAIPYFAWANRGAGEMLVWMPVAGANRIEVSGGG